MDDKNCTAINRHDRSIKLLKYGFIISFIMICLTLFAYHDNGLSDLNNAYRALLTSTGISNIDNHIDPYYFTPYYVSSLNQTAYVNGQYVNQYAAYPNKSPCYITNYKAATDPTYDELVKFLAHDDTKLQPYIAHQYTCANFAIRLHDNAEANHIKAYIVAVMIRGAPAHMIDGFHTTDRGWVFIDDTGITDDERAKGCPSTDTYVDLKPGEDYVLHDLTPVDKGNWHYDSMGLVDSYKIWDSAENYSLQNSYKCFNLFF